MTEKTKKEKRQRLAIICKSNNIDRHNLVFDFTKERTESSKDLSETELDDLIWKLNNDFNYKQSQQTTDHQRGNKQRRYMLSLCYQLGWTVWSEAKKMDVADFARLNQWCIKYGYLHKPLDNYKYKELPALVSAFENMVNKHLEKV